ncbi:MAG: VOC family protein [Nanoarchaeota archaeon]|nr:VOC family protein [Nanoarchaeota archaeon]
MQKISMCLWFDDNAEEAAKLYTSLFKDSKILKTDHYGEASAKASGRKKGSVMTVAFQLDGQKFLGLNGGPIFKFTPAISLFAYCKTEKDVDMLYKKLSTGGEVMMPLGKYPFSERYAFIKDMFGVSWQLMLSPEKPHIAPSLLFVGKDLGKAEAAARFYTSVFRRSKIDHLLLYEDGEEGEKGTVKHSLFRLEGQEFIAMDGTGPHVFGFNESISFIVDCDTQEEIDYYWEKLTEGGHEVECGWLTDKFGVSWQINPSILEKMQDDPVKSERMMKALLGMKKLDIAELKKAYDGKR